jgi:hypothetical protein
MNWKKLLLMGVGWGVGTAVGLALIVGGFLAYQSRPKPPKPWNASAIKAEYDHVTTEGKENTIVFFYILENMTDFDYRLDKEQKSTMTARLEKQNGLTPFLSSEGIEYPIFVPARKRMRFLVHMEGYSYSTKEKDDATAEERKQYRASLEKYVGEKLDNLNGFDLLDEENRYEIVFPAGWKDSESAWRPSWETVPDKTKKAKEQLSPTLTFTNDRLGAVPVLDNDEQKKLHQQDVQQNESFIQAFRSLQDCKDATFMRSNPAKADFDVQVFNGLDGRTGRWQWVLYRTDIVERLAYGEETDIGRVAKGVCAALHANVEPVGGKVE